MRPLTCRRFLPIVRRTGLMAGVGGNMDSGKSLAPLGCAAVGEVLLAAGLLTVEQRDEALAIQRRTGSRLGDILVSSGMVHPRDLYQALAKSWGVEYLDVSSTTLD